jgi:hypothetical protein
MSYSMFDKVCTVQYLIIFIHASNVVSRWKKYIHDTYLMYNKYILPYFFQGQTLRQVPGVCRGYILLDLLVEKSLSQAGQQSFLPKEGGGGQVCVLGWGGGGGGGYANPANMLTKHRSSYPLGSIPCIL